MDEREEAELIVNAIKEWATSADAVQITLPPPVAMSVLSHLQLALRHPNNDGSAAHLVEGVCQEMIEQMAPDPSGLLRKFWMMGFDPSFDVEAGDG